MTQSRDPVDSPLAFIDRYIDDQIAGNLRSLDEYLAFYPGEEDAVVREYERLQAVELTYSGSEGPPGSGESGVEARRLGPYILHEELGRGGQAVVYAAEDTRLHRRVALKVLSGLSFGSKEVLLRFRREAEMTSRLDHPGLCTVYEAGVEESVAYIAMQLVDGKSLARLIGDLHGLGSFEIEATRGGDPTTAPDFEVPTERGTIDRLVHLVEEAARALHVAHEVGIIHRDVKPGNIMVRESGSPVLLDFGLARDTDDDRDSLTQSGGIYGTPAYMSPEQAMGKRTLLDARTDIYSLGVTLYEALTLERPFQEPTRGALFQSILTKEPRNVRAVNPRVSRDLAVVVHTAMEKDPDRRFQTALDFAEELRRVRAFEPIRSRPVSRWVHLRRWVQRNPGVAASLTAAFLILVIGLGASLTFYGKERDAHREVQDARHRESQMADPHVVRSLLAEVDELWPRRAERVPAMDVWLTQARGVLERSSKRLRDLRDLRVRQPTNVEARTRLEMLEPLEEGFPVLASKVEEIERRRAFSLELARRLVEVDAQAWNGCLEALERENPPIRFQPKAGLVPLGPDRNSGLWEFWHVGSGERPAWDGEPLDEGSARRSPTSGLVLILVPGGTFTMGAAGDRRHPRYHPGAQRADTPPHEVTLSSFLISKYEMTQGQWMNVMGSDENPSEYPSGWKSVTRQHPVEFVSWGRSQQAVQRMGLQIPTEAQWECAARGGMTAAGVGGEGNLRDLSYAEALRVRANAAIDDGFALHAPVGHFPRNPWGLYDVIGNVQEWCRDRFDGPYRIPPRPGDGFRELPASFRKRVVRGGGWTSPRNEVGVARRGRLLPESRDSMTGLRPSLSIEP